VKDGKSAVVKRGVRTKTKACENGETYKGRRVGEKGKGRKEEECVKRMDPGMWEQGGGEFNDTGLEGGNPRAQKKVKEWGPRAWPCGPWNEGIIMGPEALNDRRGSNPKERKRGLTRFKEEKSRGRTQPKKGGGRRKRREGNSERRREKCQEIHWKQKKLAEIVVKSWITIGRTKGMKGEIKKTKERTESQKKGRDPVHGSSEGQYGGGVGREFKFKCKRGRGGK